mgnify:CR=1 FL=1
MGYLDQTLTIEDNEIYYNESGQKCEVMMDWEDELMSASAAYVCQNGGDILEIGFGMGISAGYIQSHSIDSHTICENHPDIIPLAQNWAQNKPNVTIVTSSWYAVKDNLGTFDGIFYDTFGDGKWVHFSASLSGLSNSNALATAWNSVPSANNDYNIPTLEYDSYSVAPPSNSYFNHTTYYLPKWQM